MTAIAAEKYVSLTTYTKDGRPKPAPVWIADLGDGTIGFTTGSDSWKLKRINNTPKVALQPSDAKGVVTPGSTEIIGNASVVSGADVERVQQAIASKYGMQYRMMRMAGKVTALIGKGDMGNAGVVITID